MRRRVLGLILAATLLAVTLLGAGTYIYVRKLMIERTEERMEDIARLLLSELEPGEEEEQAKRWLEDHQITFELRDIKTDNPTEAELRGWHRRSGLPLKRFFNTSGLQYKALGLKDRLPEMSEDEQYALLATDGMLVKRPLLVSDEFVLVGFKETEWTEQLKNK